MLGAGSNWNPCANVSVKRPNPVLQTVQPAIDFGLCNGLGSRHSCSNAPATTERPPLLFDACHLKAVALKRATYRRDAVFGPDLEHHGDGARCAERHRVRRKRAFYGVPVEIT